MVTRTKLNLGCGNEILKDWVNHDLNPLQGVDVIHDLNVLPWPFQSNSFEEIRMFHVLEHLKDTVQAMEELHRICKPGGKVSIRVPYWNSPDMITDPTHRTFFNEHSFDYFDPDKRHCKERPYYSKARFSIVKKHYYVKINGYRRVSSLKIQKILEHLARYFCGIIWVLEIELVAIK